MYTEKNSSGGNVYSETVPLNLNQTFYTPIHQFTKGNTINYYFTCDNAPLVKWSNSNKKIPSAGKSVTVS